jgi:hypothetical protein
LGGKLNGFVVKKGGASTGLPVAIRPASRDPHIHPIALHQDH